MTETKYKKQLLYNDTNTFNTWRLKEDRLIEGVDSLVSTAKEVLGSKIDYEALLKNPSDYLVNQYWNRWAKDVNPPHVNKEFVFQRDTQKTIASLDNQRVIFERLFKEMSKYTPTVTPTGLVSNLKESMFDKYLDPNKASEYYALVNFLDSAKSLKEFGYNGDVHLMKFAYGKTRMIGVNTEINLTKFI